MSRLCFTILALSLILALPCHSQPHPLAGGDMEDGVKPWALFVPEESAGAGCTLESSSETYRSGEKSARLFSVNFARYALYRKDSAVSVSPGDRYRVSAWVKSGEGTQVRPNSPGILVRLTLLGTGSADANGGHFFIGLNNWLERNRQPPSVGRIPSAWTHLEAVVEIPPGTVICQPHFFVWGVKGAVFFDDIEFEKVSVGTPLTPTASASRLAPSAPSAAELLTVEKQRDLFASLDLDQPGLSAVKEAVARDDLSLARNRFANYLRTRTLKSWFIAPFNPSTPTPGYSYRKERAESGAVGRITPSGLAELWHTFPENIIDWYWNETQARPGLAYNPEWQWQLCRMSFWGDMANAYRATADEKFARAWVTQFRSFIAQCPAPVKVMNVHDSAWRTIECGIRMRDSWPRAFHAFLRSPSVTDEDLLLYVHACLEHAGYLQKFPSEWGNWLTMEMCGLHTIGTVFPEFNEAAKWRAAAIEALAASLSRQFLPDGAQYESSPGYHVVALDENGMAIPRLAAATGRSAEIPSDYISSMEKGYDYLLYLMTPDRSQPCFNDSWPVTWLKPIFKNGLGFFPQRQDWRWIATDGSEGRAPSATSHAFPYVGYYVMRSGWDTAANYIAFDAGPLGYAHQHQDKLNVVMHAYGREILFDGGGGSYENSKWRAYAIDTYSHNTVIVDGLPQRRPLVDEATLVATAPNDVVWQSTPDFDFAAGSYDGAYSGVGIWAEPQPAGPARHTRRVLFSKPDLVVVADTLEPLDSQSHTYQARWHLLPVKTLRNEATLAITTADPDLPNLAVIPLRVDNLEVRAVSAQTQPELLGWHVRKDTDPQYVPATTVLHTRSGTGIQTFVTLLVPLHPGASNPVQAVQPINATDTQVTLADGRQLLIVVPAAPRELIQVVRQ